MLRLNLLMVSLIFGFGVIAEEKAPAKIFILHSYEDGHVCGQPQHDGVVSVLKKKLAPKGRKLDLKAYHMDTKRKNNTPELIKEQAEIAKKKIAEFKPDVLVVLDDNAFRTVALDLLDTDLPIIFSGMNGQIEDYNKKRLVAQSREEPGHNISGVYEKLHVSDAFRVHSKLFPGLKKVRIFVDESPTGKAIYKQMNKELLNEKIPCEYDIKIVKNWEEYQQEILKTNNDPEIGAIYPAALLLKDKNGKTYTAPQIFGWTSEHSTKPEMALNYAFTRLGLFGGAAVDFHAMGKQAGEMVFRILQEEDAGGIAIEDAEKYALAFNLKRAKKLGLEIPQDILLAADEIVKE